MKTFTLTTLAFTLLFAWSCNSSKVAKEAKESTTATMEMTAKDRSMAEAGFKLGSIEVSDAEGDCPYTIKTEDGGNMVYLDPINLEEPYKVQGQEVWFKYSGLRMMNRCDKANPINLIEIQKREE